MRSVPPPDDVAGTAGPRATPAGGPRATPDDDLTARARIRDAAVARFAADGFGASVRAIAADAGVSAGLVLHHFGSKEGLRQACDAHVLAQIHEARAGVLDRAALRNPVALLAADEHYAWLATYLLRSLQAGGDLARRTVADVVADTRATLDAGVASGLVRPSRDPEARADLLTRMSLGYLLLDYALLAEPPADLAHWVLDGMERSTLAGLEVFTEGVFADTTVLDAYLADRPDPSGRGDHPDHADYPDTSDHPAPADTSARATTSAPATTSSPATRRSSTADQGLSPRDADETVGNPLFGAGGGAA